MAGAPQKQQDLIPIPDPSLLTTEALNREIAHLRETFEAERRNVKERFEQQNKQWEEKFTAFHDERAEADVRNQQRFDAQNVLLDEKFNTAAALRNEVNNKSIERFASIEKMMDVVASASERVIDERFSNINIRIERQNHELDLRYQQRFDAQTKALDAAFLSAQTAVTAAMAASEKAVSKAEVSTEKRFDSTLEFQRSLNETISQQMPRREVEARIDSLAVKVDDLKAYAASTTGKSTGMNALWGIVIGAVGFIATIGALFSMIHK